MKKVKSKKLSADNSSSKKSGKAAEVVMDKLVETANKKYGINVLRKGFPSEEENKWYELQRFPSGIPSLDIGLGGGIPIGRYTEIQGGESVGKTSIVLNIVREFQKAFPDLSALFSDGEGTTNAYYMRKLEINPEQIYYNPSAGLEESTQLILDQMTADSPIRLGVIDSIESLVPTKEYDKNMDDSMQMGVKPVLMAEFFRKFFAYNNRLLREGHMPFTLIGLNQLRDKIGGFSYDNEFAPGGRAKNFAQSACIRIRRADSLYDGKNENKVLVGHTVKFKIYKNKTYGPGKTGEFDLYTEEPNEAEITKGWVDVPLSIILEAMKYGVIKRRGSYYYLDSNPDDKYQGRDAMIQHLIDKPETVNECLQEILEIVRKK